MPLGGRHSTLLGRSEEVDDAWRPAHWEDVSSAIAVRLGQARLVSQAMSSTVQLDRTDWPDIDLMITEAGYGFLRLILQTFGESQCNPGLVLYLLKGSRLIIT